IRNRIWRVATRQPPLAGDAPIRLNSDFSLTGPSDATGRLLNARMRFSRDLSATRKASHLSASDPSTAAGSGIPQRAVIGLPGQIGQTSPAALSQTVMTNCICGAPGASNSSQDLDRRPAVGKSNCLSSANAIG